jgi:hypothetical protein
MNDSLVSFTEYMRGCLITGFFPQRRQNFDYLPQYSYPQLRHRVSEARILRSGNGNFRSKIAMCRSMKAMLRSKKESCRSFCAILSEKIRVIPICNRNVAMKKRNVAIDNGKVEVGERNGTERYEKFHASHLDKENTEFETLHNVRAQIIVHDNRLKCNATGYHTIANEAFDNLCKVVTGLFLCR